jgi:hypothetical protein
MTVPKCEVIYGRQVIGTNDETILEIHENPNEDLMLSLHVPDYVVNLWKLGGPGVYIK